MRATPAFVLGGLLLAGCPKKSPTADLQVSTVPTGPTTELGCAPGDDEYGARPPDGFDLWCGKQREGEIPERSGPARTWWPDGSRREAGFYAAGLKTGHWWRWDAEGWLSEQGPYVSDLQHGYWVFYRKDGSIVEEGHYDRGLRTGVWVSYDPTAGTSQEGRYEDGEREGVWVELTPGGTALRERVFRRGRLINQREL